MKIRTVAITSILAGAVLTGCAKPDDRLPSDVTTAVSRDFNEGNPDRVAGHYADDAEILVAHHPAIEGKAAIAVFFKANIDKYIGLGNDTTWSEVRGDMAVEQGVYTVRNVKVGENVETGKYIRVWKNINGSWKLYRDMFSSDSELSGAVSVAPEESTLSNNPAPQ